MFSFLTLCFLYLYLAKENPFPPSMSTFDKILKSAWNYLVFPLTGCHVLNLYNKHFHVCESRECWPWGRQRSGGSWGQRYSLNVALPCFQIRIKVSNATLLKVCPMSTEVGREGNAGGVVFPQNCTLLCFLT